MYHLPGSRKHAPPRGSTLTDKAITTGGRRPSRAVAIVMMLAASALLLPAAQAQTSSAYGGPEETFYLHQRSNDLMEDVVGSVTGGDPPGAVDGALGMCIGQTGSVDALAEGTYMDRNNEFPYRDAEPSDDLLLFGATDLVDSCANVGVADLQDPVGDTVGEDIASTQIYPALTGSGSALSHDGFGKGDRIDASVFLAFLLGSPLPSEVLFGEFTLHAALAADGTVVATAEETHTYSDIAFGYVELDPGIDELDWNRIDTQFFLDEPVPADAELSFGITLETDAALHGGVYYVGYNKDHASFLTISPLLPATLAGEACVDVDEDGECDEDEARDPGVVVYIDEDGDGELDDGEPTTTTDSEGAYSFDIDTDALTQQATVCEIVPDNMVATSDVCKTLDVTSGETTTAPDFTNRFQDATVFGSVCVDSDGDGSCEGEGPLGGVTIFIDEDGNGTLDDGEPTMTTGSDGRFHIVTAMEEETQTIRVCQVVPDGMEATAGLCRDVVLTAGGVSRPDPFADKFLDARIEGEVCLDADRDQVCDQGEEPLQGIKVFIDEDGDGVHDSHEPSTTTDADGGYDFELPSDSGGKTFRICEELPDTMVATGPRCRTVEVEPDEMVTADDFTNRFKDATVDGSVCLDDDADGDCSGEGPLSGVTVFIDRDGDGVQDPDEPSGVSGAGGSFSLTTPMDAEQDDITVCQIVPDTMVDTNGLCRTVTVTAGDSEPVDPFGDRFLGGLLHGGACLDTDADGTCDDGEGPLEGLTVFIDEDGDGELDDGETRTQTGPDGTYELEAPDTGEQTTVCQVVPTGLTPTSPICRNGTVGPGETLTLDSFTNQALPGSIEGLAVHDIDGDGTQDADEPALNGVTIRLIRDGDVIATQETRTIGSDDGRFAFVDVTPFRSYVVEQDLPGGWLQTIPTGDAHQVPPLGADEDVELLFGRVEAPTGAVEGVQCIEIKLDGLCNPDLIRGTDPDLVFVVDVSYSTHHSFAGTSVGDLNNDGEADTILDGEIAGFLALLERTIDEHGDTADVAIVAFQSDAEVLDMDPRTSGHQVSIAADARDDNGDLIIENLLRELVPATGLGQGLTNYEDALRKTREALETMESAEGARNVVFLSDGFPTLDEQGHEKGDPELSETFVDEADYLCAEDGLATNVRAFGAGTSARLEDLNRIDCEGEALEFTTGDALVAEFGGLSEAAEEEREEGVAGVTVFADLNGNGALDDDEPRTQTNATGHYTLDDVPTGTQSICHILPSGADSVSTQCHDAGVDDDDVTQVADFADAYMPSSDDVAALSRQVAESLEVEFIDDSDGTRAELSFAAPAGLDGIQVWRATSPWVLLATLDDDATSYTDDDAPAGAKYTVTGFQTEDGIDVGHRQGSPEGSLNGFDAIVADGLYAQNVADFDEVEADGGTVVLRNGGGEEKTYIVTVRVYDADGDVLREVDQEVTVPPHSNLTFTPDDSILDGGSSYDILVGAPGEDSQLAAHSTVPGGGSSGAGESNLWWVILIIVIIAVIIGLLVALIVRTSRRDDEPDGEPQHHDEEHREGPRRAQA